MVMPHPPFQEISIKKTSQAPVFFVRQRSNSLPTVIAFPQGSICEIKIHQPQPSPTDAPKSPVKMGLTDFFTFIRERGNSDEAGQRGRSHGSVHLTSAEGAQGEPEPRTDGRIELTEELAYYCLGFTWPTWKKWWILSSVFVVQLSMNFNAAIYANASGMKKEFGIDTPHFKLGQMAFLVAYAIGCEAWAPWSEELGRKWVLQGSLFLVNLFQLPCALATNYNSVIAGRVLGGLSSAGGSVTLGMVADLWEPAQQQYAVAYVVLSSVAGSIIAPIFGGFIEEYAGWRWT